MSFFDTLKDKLRGTSEEDFGEDYYDEYQEGSVGEPSVRVSHSNRLLGNTPRPEANSVSVYTRGGRRVDTGEFAPAPHYDTTYEPQSYVPTAPYVQAQPQVTGPISQAQLPPYVLRPVSYDDVQTVIRRVKTDQPVVLTFKNTNIDIAKRILDFCFGLSCGINGKVEEIDDKVFVVLPPSMQLGKVDFDNLCAQGIISHK